MVRNDYQTMMQELQAILTDMQSESLDADTVIEKYKRGQKLISDLKKYLKTAENQIIHHKLPTETE